MLTEGRKKPAAMTEFETGTVARILREHRPAKVYLEIGARYGGSLNYFGRCFPAGSSLVAVDLVGGVWGRRDSEGQLRENQVDLQESGYKVDLVLGDSKTVKVIQRVSKILSGRQVDVLFLDGDHRPHGVAADLTNYAPLVRPGGIVMFHDCGTPGAQVDGPEDTTKTITGVRGVFEWFAFQKKHLVIQEASGLGLVWI